MHTEGKPERQKGRQTDKPDKQEAGQKDQHKQRQIDVHICKTTQTDRWRVRLVRPN